MYLNRDAGAGRYNSKGRSDSSGILFSVFDPQMGVHYEVSTELTAVLQTALENVLQLVVIPLVEGNIESLYG